MRGVWLLGLLLIGACGASPEPPSAGAWHEVRYRLEWAWDDATRIENGPAWEVTNDRGYRVRVTRGYVTSYSMELVECPRDAGASPGERLGSLLGWTVEGTAWAGHSAGTANPAAIRPMQVESLTEPTARDVGQVLLAPQAYCQLHYLIARAGREAPGLPPDVEMVDASLHVDGTYQARDASAATPFTLHTAVANGGLFDRPAGSRAAMRVDTGKNAARVIVRRHLGRIFDGVEFASMTEHQVAGEILKSLIDHVEVEIDILHEGE
jgi:hypothetical protein